MDPYYILVDTETTGLPKNWRAPLTDLNNWPRIVQIAWLVYTIDGQEIAKNNFTIKPENFTIPQESIKIHGITNEYAIKNGEQLKMVLNLFQQDLSKCKCIVGHNISFDINIIAAEYMRNNIDTKLLMKMQNLCTMKLTKDFCMIPRYDGKGYKYPKLSELYKFLFRKEFANEHSALGDIIATAECFWELQKLSQLFN